MYSKLAFGYRYQDKPNSAIIYVVTKAGFKSFLSMIRKIDLKVEDLMLESRKRDLESKK